MTKPATNNPNKFHLKLTESEWKKLEAVATKRGKKNVRRFIYSEMHRLAKTLSPIIQKCDCKPTKRRNYYPIPEELKPFFKKLSCQYGVETSKIMFRLIISPYIDATITENTL